ncbi:MAG: sugar phosphate isomerase/epimerase family protein [Rhodothermales bacterium]
MNRRVFIQQSGLVAASAAFWSCSPGDAPSAAASADAKLARIGITTVSLRSRFAQTHEMMAEPYEGPMLNLETAPAYIAGELGLHNVEVWERQFDDTSIAYCERVRAAAERAGSRITNIQVSGLANLSSMDADERAQGVTQAREWVDRAVAIGAPSIRVDAGGRAGDPFDLAVTVDSYRRIVDYAGSKGVVILVENHSGFTRDIDTVVAIIEAIESPNCRALADYGNTPAGSIEDRIAGLQKMLPYLAFVSAKGTGFDEQMRHSDYDFAALVRATEASGYRGIYSIEMWPDADSPPPADPLRAAGWMKDQLIANIGA